MNSKKRERENQNTTEKPLVSSILSVFKKVSVELLGEPFKLENKCKEFNDFYAFAYRFVTGINPPEVNWFEVVFVRVDELNREKYNEILKNIQEWKPFKYHNGYDKYYGRIVYIIPNKLKGIYRPKLVVKRTFIDVRVCRRFERTLYVVLNTKLSEEKVVASALAYLINYFVKRVLALESAIFNTKRENINIWRRVRKIFNGTMCGKDAKLSCSLRLLYNNIYYRVELLEENGRIGEHLAKTIKLLTELFFTFAKVFDKYASKVYSKIVSYHLYKLIKKKVGFQNIPIFTENIKKIWNIVNSFLIRSEAEKILRAKAIT